MLVLPAAYPGVRGVKEWRYAKEGVEMRWPNQKFAGLLLAGAFSALALAQHGTGNGHGGGALGAPAARGISSTAAGAGATLGPARISSTAVGAGATLGTAGQRGYLNGNRLGSRPGNGYGRDYRNIPYPFFFSPYYYPFLDYGSAPYGGEPEQMAYDPSADSDLVTQNLLGEQVQRLAAELDQMKYAQYAQQPGQAMPMSPSPAAAPPVDPPAPPLTVVLRNGQKLQVQNYAVMDNTFWDFSKQPARKIPISTIDVAASSEATAANGGEFPQLGTK